MVGGWGGVDKGKYILQGKIIFYCSTAIHVIVIPRIISECGLTLEAIGSLLFDTIVEWIRLV